MLGLLSLPPALAVAYEHVIQAQGLIELATRSNVEEGPTGGMTPDQTFRHFSQRFAGSCGRVEMALLDPKLELGACSDVLLKAFAGGVVKLLDIPSGAGSATASLLSTLAELRSRGILPRFPLTVLVTGGEISETARQLASQLLTQLQPALEREAIHVQSNWLSWDVGDAFSTTALIDAWLSHGPRAGCHVAVVSNFSAYLASNLDRAKRQIENVLQWVSVRRSDLVWVEPTTNVATDNFWPGLFRKVLSGFRRWFNQGGTSATEHIRRTEVALCHPLRPSERVRVHLTLMRLTHNDPTT
ncbi:MAG: hypothetical protein HY674_02440 [Chloroflexi bacterium]|nr:hypothetical protein [Chloroflexota bacterium]